MSVQEITIVVAVAVFVLGTALAWGVQWHLDRAWRRTKSDNLTRVRAREENEAFNRDPDRYLRLIAKGLDPVDEMRPGPRPPRGSGGVVLR